MATVAVAVASTGAFLSYAISDISELKDEELKLEDKPAVGGRIHPSEFSDWSISGDCGNKCPDGMEIAL